MVSNRRLILKPSSPFTNHSGIIPSASITIGITVTFMFHSFFSSLACSRYFSLLSNSFHFTLWSARTAKSTIRQVLFSFHFFFLFVFFLFFFFCLLSLDLVVWPILCDPFESQNLIEVCTSHFPGWILGDAYTTCSYRQIMVRMVAYMIDRFVSFTLQPTFAIFFRLIYFCFNVVCPYGVVLYSN